MSHTAPNPPINPPINAAINPRLSAARSGLGVLMRADLFTALLPGVHTLGGQGNTLAVETSQGVVIVDAGPGGQVTRGMIERLRELSHAPLRAIVYSHGHAGYNAGVQIWLEHAAARGDAQPALIAHAGVVPRYRRYLETAGLQAWLNSRQFRKSFAVVDERAFPPPTITFDKALRLEDPKRPIDLVWAPSETDDALALWLPNERFLYAGAALIRSIPNIGTPLRTWRDALRWAETLQRLHALRPALLLPEFGSPITAPQDIDDALGVPMRALRWLRAEVVRLMNQGLAEREILATIQYPQELFGHQFMRAIYGDPDYIVRDLWRGENGWWDRNPTHLHPARPAEAAAAVLAALGDPAAVLARAQALADAGQAQQAMHVVDLLALAPGDEGPLPAARELKARLCEARARQVSSVVSRHLYLSSAEDLRGQPVGSTRADDPPSDFSWD